MTHRTGLKEARTGPSSSKSERPVAYIDGDRCDRSPSCPVMKICPKNAVVRQPAESPKGSSFLGSLFGGPTPVEAWTVDEDTCSGCLLCAQYCPHGAVVPRERKAG